MFCALPCSLLTEEGEGTKSQHALLTSGSESVNPYHILRVRRDATVSEIRQSYRRLALLNHPGRSYDTDEQQKRRLQLFEVLSAAYECLVDDESRDRYDLHLSVVEQLKMNKGLAGKMFVGGKFSSPAPPRSKLSTDFDISIPSLSPSSSSSSASAEKDLLLVDEGDDLTITTVGEEEEEVVESMMNHSESSNIQYIDDGEMERLFEGPLTDLFRARNFEPFTDSLTVFEQVFGSQVFDVSREELSKLKSWEPIQSLKYPSGWEGSSTTSDDGKTTIFTTSRILYDRRVIRKETIVVDPITGKRHKHTTVTSEPLTSNNTLEVEEEVEKGGICYGLCGGTDSRTSSGNTEDSFMCEEFFEFYREMYTQIVEYMSTFFCYSDSS